MQSGTSTRKPFNCCKLVYSQVSFFLSLSLSLFTVSQRLLSRYAQVVRLATCGTDSVHCQLAHCICLALLSFVPCALWTPSFLMDTSQQQPTVQYRSVTIEQGRFFSAIDSPEFGSAQQHFSPSAASKQVSTSCCCVC